MEGVPPFAIYDPGADSASNGARRQKVRAVTVHTTQGRDSRGVGKTRRHSSPGTFNFLNRDDGLWCYYPADVRCSHAAGANSAGPGIENEGFTGQPLTANQIANLGRLARWLSDTYGVPLNLYDGPRIAVDNSGYSGFVNHASVETSPIYRHSDRIPPDEWQRALGPAPSSPQEHPTMTYLHVRAADTYYIVTPSWWVQLTDNAVIFDLAKAGLFKDVDPQTALALMQTVDAQAAKPWTRLFSFIAKLFPKKAERAGTP